MGQTEHASAATAEFGQRVRARREHLGLTQMQLAERAGLHFTYVSDVERGRRNPSLLTALRLAAALGTDLAPLVKGLKIDDSRQWRRHPPHSDQEVTSR
ncbi:MAG: helix-turn-helix transcriptional regulator [Acidimicrobiaceae bacterium]|nr:helix-turn-helix transcriptional regulator [Acidimicrobiaceae bacterium]